MRTSFPDSTIVSDADARLVDFIESMPDLAQIEMELAAKSLKDFIALMWRSVETERYVTGWHLDAITEHLEAVTRREITRLLINMPPRHMKSLGVSVFWPAWEWLQFPQHRFLFASYAYSLALRDSVKCRRVIDSGLYQRMMQARHPGFALVDDQNTKIRYENTEGGYRIATSVTGALTGEGGDTIVIDDPHNITEAESEVVRETTLKWWDEAMSTRLNDPKRGSFVVIMQRSHERDLAGHILAKEHGWTHLCLPARYEGQNRIVSPLGWTDPRTEIDEPLWPERFGDVELKRLESALGLYGSAGQLQQRPSPRAGGVFKVAKFSIVPDVNPKEIAAKVRYWDKAGSAGRGCYTAGVLMARMKSGQFVVLDVVRGQWEAGEREQRIFQTALMDDRKTEIWVEQEPGSGGLESAQSTIRRLAGFRAYPDRVTGSKVVRAEPYAAQVEIGNVAVLNRAWTSQFLDEHQSFPNGVYKDQVDAAAGAFAKVASPGGGFLALD